MEKVLAIYGRSNPFVGHHTWLVYYPTHERNEKAAKKHIKWKLWSSLYKSFIIDMFLRAQAPKTIRRSNLLISAYLLLGNINKSCWKLLQRLRIVVSKDTVKKWIAMHTKELKSPASILFYVFDNCNFHLHVTRVYTTHGSSFLNLITHFIVEIPHFMDVAASEVWKAAAGDDKVDFGNWLQSNSDNSNAWSTYSWETFIK